MKAANKAIRVHFVQKNGENSSALDSVKVSADHLQVSELLTTATRDSFDGKQSTVAKGRRRRSQTATTIEVQRSSTAADSSIET
jgi:hypothetical protein